jgi:hypothetical protein
MSPHNLSILVVSHWTHVNLSPHTLLICLITHRYEQMAITQISGGNVLVIMSDTDAWNHAPPVKSKTNVCWCMTNHTSLGQHHLHHHLTYKQVILWLGHLPCCWTFLVVKVPSSSVRTWTLIYIGVIDTRQLNDKQGNIPCSILSLAKYWNGWRCKKTNLT